MRYIKKTFAIVLIAVMAFTLMPVDKTYAASKQAKVTWNANGGDFTAKKYAKKSSYNKKITKGKKVGKLPQVKRDGYKFKGWYTKPTSGNKITKNTKVKKNVKYYAQWKRSLNSAEQKLVGTWGMYFDGTTIYKFNADGTYICYSHFYSFTDMRAWGFWSIKNGVLTRTAQWSYQTNKDTAGYIEEWGYTWTPWGEWETFSYLVRFGTEDESSSYRGKQYVDIYKSESNFSKGTQRYIKDLVGSAPW